MLASSSSFGAVSSTAEEGGERGQRKTHLPDAPHNASTTRERRDPLSRTDAPEHAPSTRPLADRNPITAEPARLSWPREQGPQLFGATWRLSRRRLSTSRPATLVGSLPACTTLGRLSTRYRRAARPVGGTFPPHANTLRRTLLADDLLNPSVEDQNRSHKLKRVLQRPNSCFMDAKCPACMHSTSVFSHAHTTIICGRCPHILAMPTGGIARPTEGASFRQKYA